jgi:hypothetical protein
VDNLLNGSNSIGKYYFMFSSCSFQIQEMEIIKKAIIINVLFTMIKSDKILSTILTPTVHNVVLKMCAMNH